MFCIRLIGAHVALVSRGVLAPDYLLNGLIPTFAEFDGIGMVVPQLVTSDGRVVNFGDEIHRGSVTLYDHPQLNQNSSRHHVNYESQICAVIAGEVWQKIDWFDEVYSRRHCPLLNLSYRVRELGYECLYVPSTKLTLDSDRCSDLVEGQGCENRTAINRIKLKARWHRSSVAKDNWRKEWQVDRITNDIRQVLVVDFDTPQPDANAGGYAALKEMQVLQSIGYQVTFIPRNLEYAGAHTDAIQRMGIECVHTPFYEDIDEFLSKRAREFSLIYVTRYHVAQDFLAKFRQYVPTAKIVLMLADLHFLRELRAALHNNDDEQLSQAMETRENELAVMRKVDLVLSYTDVEKTVILSHNLASTKVAKCPWVCDVVKCVSGFENRVDIAFLGGFNHTPNVEAMVWFIERVLPTLLKQLPEAQLRIYGSAIPHSIKDLAGSNSRIQVLGWVSDVASVYNSCRVFIAPLQSGAGIKGKVIGALAHGLPSVLSDIAVEGIGVCDEIHAFVASSPDEWVNRIKMLYTDQVLWEQMSQHAISFAKRHYSLDNAIVEMKAALSTVGIEPILEPKALVWKGPWRSVAQI